MEQTGMDEIGARTNGGERARGTDEMSEERLPRGPQLAGEQVGRQFVATTRARELGVGPVTRYELVVELEVGLRELMHRAPASGGRRRRRRAGPGTLASPAPRPARGPAWGRAASL